MISFTDFINKWNGRGIDFDGAYGDQCMDLMHQYIVEVLGLSDGRILAAGYAYQVFTNFTNIYGNQYFDKIVNTPTGIPKNGDIMFWGPNEKGVTGIAGHVGIYKDGDVNRFNSFDQNYPTGSKCKIVNHSYAGVLGWLRLKQSISPDMKIDRIKNVLNGGGTSTDKLKNADIIIHS